MNQFQSKTIMDKDYERLLNKLQQEEFSGRMLLNSEKAETWTFYFYLGRIIYATGGLHPVRRYQRNLCRYIPEILSEWKHLSSKPQIIQDLDTNLSWEYDLLNHWLQAKKVNPEQVNQFIKAQVKEIIFDITEAKQITFKYEQGKSYQRPLTLINSEQITLEAWKLRQNWQDAKLADRSPDFAPIIIKPEELRQRVSGKTFEAMQKLLDGKKSIRDLTVQLPQQNIVQLTSLLHPYIQTGLIELVKIEDLKSPIQSPTTYIPLIACVDDNLGVCSMMESIVKANNCRFLGISDELRAINMLLKYKPDMIFLDFIMPKLNGYELCRMLRKIPEFNDKPIIILSAYQNVVEHFRGKLSGCSGFVSKPIEAQVISNKITEHMVELDREIIGEQAPHAGKIQVYQNDKRELTELDWVELINKAIDTNKFQLFQQTIMPINSQGKISRHIEVLLRMINRDGQLLTPNLFLPVAEKYNLMPAIDKWVIETLFSLRKKFQNSSLDSCMYGVNLSGSSINSQEFINFILEKLEQYQILPQSICFEITETQALMDLEQASRFVKTLQAIGCKFALDDFGTGMSSFSYLQKLPVNYLKIDGSFIRNIDTDDTSYAIVDSTIQLSRKMGIKTIAEFVSNQSIFNKLVDLSVDYVQGYFIGKPQTIEL
ncbi:EAL domain-containing protein [Gloeocapsa sp. PCC 73106]|uniref:EAL domain-containing protein n=1 Tax=Gloeocapsa sp. PCC 73106 TaxID=102232 RepID=UPI0002ABDD1F|nr:EAL domain-containing protein [Gloeocapsa sp. PCC 73106]ELS00173.1 EAL domain-containing protein [Gloeocapsa sp. PCC 73106]